MARTTVENGKTLRYTGLTDRKFGVELELFATRANPGDRQAVISALTAVGVDVRSEEYNHRTRTWWKIVADATVQTPGGRMGVELVSPPLSGEAGLAEVEKVCAALATIGAWVSRSCGMHVHHDAAGLTCENIHDLAFLMNRFAPVFDGLVPESRRRGQSQMCEHWSESHLEDLSHIRSLDRLRDRFYDGGSARYRTLNLNALVRHGTVEFRQHSGTVEADKVCSWVLLTQGLVEKAWHLERPASPRGSGAGRAPSGPPRARQAVSASPRPCKRLGAGSTAPRPPSATCGTAFPRRSSPGNAAHRERCA